MRILQEIIIRLHLFSHKTLMGPIEEISTFKWSKDKIVLNLRVGKGNRNIMKF